MGLRVPSVIGRVLSTGVVKSVSSKSWNASVLLELLVLLLRLVVPKTGEAWATTRVLNLLWSETYTSYADSRCEQYETGMSRSLFFTAFMRMVLVLHDETRIQEPLRMTLV